MHKIITLLIILCIGISCSEREEYAEDEESLFDNLDYELDEIEQVESIPMTTREAHKDVFKMDSLQELISILTTDSLYHAKNIGSTGVFSRKYAAFERIKELVNNKELILLTKHELPVVRAYAYQAIKDKNIQLDQEQLEAYKNDCEKLVYFSGCLQITQTVSKDKKCYQNIHSK